MLVVSDTSPVCNLAVIGRLNLLQLRYGKILVPPVVEWELQRLSHSKGKRAIQDALKDGWLVVRSPTRELKLTPPLDLGESQAIVLAAELKADVLLIDEKRGRAAARKLSLPVGGVLGELLHAKFAGRIPSVRPELARLRSEAGFFIAPEIEAFVLDHAGE